MLDDSKDVAGNSSLEAVVVQCSARLGGASKHRFAQFCRLHATVAPILFMYSRGNDDVRASTTSHHRLHACVRDGKHTRKSIGTSNAPVTAARLAWCATMLVTDDVAQQAHVVAS